MKLQRAGLENYSEPLGICGDLYFFWQYDGMEGSQKSYRIEIFDTGHTPVYDSNIVESSEQNQILVPRLEWKSLQQYDWKIQTWDKEEQCCGEISGSFVTGVMPQDENRGQWISAMNRKPFYAFYSLKNQKKIKAAYAAVCGLGQFELKINGTKVGNHVLDPGWTDYNDQLQYVTFDVSKEVDTDCLFQIEVANGWYLGDTIAGRHFYTMDKGYEPFGSVLPLWALIHLVYEDGEDWIGTSQEWVTLKSDTTLANVYGSEDYHAEFYQGRPQDYFKTKGKPAVCLSKDLAPKGVLTPQMHPPVIVKKVYETQSVRELGDRKYLFDLGQNMSGLFEIIVCGKRGQKVFITPVEKLKDDGTPWKTLETWSCYTLSGGEETEVWKPKFSYSAGRWVIVEGATLEKTEDFPQIITVRGHFITSSAEDTGFFSCSENKYNQIYQLVLKAEESNLNHVHTDCPSAEKLGWLEPNHLMAASVMFQKNVNTLWSKIARDMREAQYTSEEWDQDISCYGETYGPGLVPSVAPRYARFLQDGGDGSFWDIVPWGSSVILAPEFQYQFYGNLESVRDNYDAGMKYLDYLTDLYEHYGEIYHKTGNEKFLCHGLGDWGIGHGHRESRENTETAIYYADLITMEKHAKLLGKNADQMQLQKRAREVLARYNDSLLKQHPQTGEWYYYAYDSPESTAIIQANQAIPLYYGMVPAEKEESVKKSFLQSVESHQFIAGEIGLRYIFIMLSRYGRNEIIHDMILQKEHPSYYRFVEQGETTLPEFWDDHARSRNHDMMGHVMQWFYEGVGGISSKDAFRHIMIHPSLVKNLTDVQCSYQSIRGEIKVEVKDDPQTQTGRMEVTVPGNCFASVTVPGEWKDRSVYYNGSMVSFYQVLSLCGGTMILESTPKKM